MKNSRGAYKMLASMIRTSNAIKDFVIRPPRTPDPKWSQRIFRYLQTEGYIEPIGESDNFYLTDLGKINTLQEIVKNRKSDGRIRAVIFDIPEKLKSKRNGLRYHLSQLGFKMEQKSVWSSKIPCEDLVKLVVEHHELGKYTALIIGTILPLDKRSHSVSS